MATAKKSVAKEKAKTKASVKLLKSSENFLIEKEKRYQRKVKGPQVENQTTLKETRKKAAPKAKAKLGKKG